MNALERLRFQRDVEHLHGLGSRAIAEALIEIMHRVGGEPAIMGVLTEWRRLSPGQVRAAGGDRFPPPVSVVTAELRRAAR